MSIAKRELGKTGVAVTMLGLGGEGVLRTVGYDKEAYSLINTALDLGVTYCESARAYDGSESYYGKALRERRGDVFLTSKSHARDKEGALAHLEKTLHDMNTDYLDLWQVHDVRTHGDLGAIFGPGGAIEAFDEAKRKGMTRFVGVTGHHDPAVLRTAMETYPFDTVLMPVNAAEPAHRSFLAEVLPLALERQMGVVGMKVYLRGLASRVPGYSTMEPYLRYALSQPVSTVVIGCDNVQHLADNVAFARRFTPMTEEEQQALTSKVAPFALQLMYYKP